MIDGWLKLFILEKMNDGSLLLAINEITHYFKKWTTGSGALKKIYFLYKNVMFQIDPLKSSCSQKQQYSEGTFKVKSTPKEQPFGESGCYENHKLQVQLFMNNCNYCCEIVKLAESNCSKSHPCNWKCLQLPF